MTTLPPKQQAFVEHYAACGNATEAALKAGYSERYAGTNTRKLLNNTKIKTAITELNSQVSNSRIANAKERQEFWTAVMRGDVGYEADMKDRLKASELLGKAKGDFIDESPAATTINNLWITPEILRTIREVVYGLA
ncbi:MAG: terminase small subunit [Candidatus Contendobacter sp.]|jgi:phage terminase small subunit|nr:terminase small subunit [Candidatus Contendobacter sp.]